jgi:hypothetical protein
MGQSILESIRGEEELNCKHTHTVFPLQVQNLMARAEYLKEQVKVSRKGPHEARSGGFSLCAPIPLVYAVAPMSDSDSLSSHTAFVSYR